MDDQHVNIDSTVAICSSPHHRRRPAAGGSEVPCYDTGSESRLCGVVGGVSCGASSLPASIFLPYATASARTRLSSLSSDQVASPSSSLSFFFPFIFLHLLSLPIMLLPFPGVRFWVRVGFDVWISWLLSYLFVCQGGGGRQGHTYLSGYLTSRYIGSPLEF